MDTFTACRICLNTDVKLYNMSQYRLKFIYEDLCGSNASEIDEIPDYVCSYCAASLNKFASFKEKCKQSKHLMEFLISEPKHLTADHLRHITTIKANLTLPYTFHKLYILDSTLTDIKDEYFENLETKYDGDLEIADDFKNNEFLEACFMNDSDDEPLSTIVREGKKRKKDKDTETTLTDIKDEYFENLETKYDGDLEIADDFKNKEFLEACFMNDSDDEPLSTIVREGKKSKKDKDTEIHLCEPRTEIESTFVSNDVESVDLDINVDDSVTAWGSNDVDSSVTKCESYDYDLVLLTKEQQIEEVLARKKSSNYLNSRYKCEYCFKGFMTDLTYKNHMVRHDVATGAFPCAVCGARWADARTRRAHAAAAHERNYLCKMCPHTAKSHHKAKEHLQWHKGFLFVCQICGVNFKKNTTYLTHIRLQHASTTTTCVVCGAACLGKVGLNMHMKKAHKKTEWNIEYLQCNICNSKFRNEGALKRHRESAVDEKCDTEVSALHCEYCGDGFADGATFKEHLEMHRRVYKTCNECSRTFASERSLAAHLRRAHSAGEARARTAGAAHCVCEICGFTCISRVSLVYHQRTHTGEKPFECSLCKKRFSVYQRLQIHIRTHTGERPFKCGVCPKAFKHKAALNRHNRVHTGARPYRCATCGKAFSQSNSMKQHAASVHLKAPLYARKTKQNKL